MALPAKKVPSVSPILLRGSEVMIVGEFPTKGDLYFSVPMAGNAGKELKRMLAKADLNYDRVSRTTVFKTYPDDGKIESFCAKKAEAQGELLRYPLPPISAGKYITSDRLGALEVLKDEILRVQPRLIIALGNVACWATIGQTGIGKLRGHKFDCVLPGCENIPVIPTYSPSNILRQWDLRVVAVADLIKASRFLRGEMKAPVRRLLLEPTKEEVFDWLDTHIHSAERPLKWPISFDIETARETITCIGFSVNPTEGVCIPFHDPGQADGNYWRSLEDELEVWLAVKAVLENADPKLGQNGLYDIQYCYRYGIHVENYEHDTMIRHHAMYPEMEKGLGFMASIYTDEAPWKMLRRRNKDNFKLDDE